MKGVGRSFLSVTINQQPSSISTPTDPVMATADSSQPLGSQSQKESPKTTSSQTQSSQISPSLRWLGTCGQLFRPAEKDTKDVLCMIEVLQDRVLRTDVVLAEVEKVLLQQIRDFMAKQAQYCENVFANDAAIVKAIREADDVNRIVTSQLESSQLMSRTLLQRITGIIESPPAPRTSNGPNLAPSK